MPSKKNTNLYSNRPTQNKKPKNNSAGVVKNNKKIKTRKPSFYTLEDVESALAYHNHGGVSLKKALKKISPKAK